MALVAPAVRWLLEALSETEAKKLKEELQPMERAARLALGEAVAAEQGHRSHRRWFSRRREQLSR